jgi:hypothetical protein
MRIPHRPISIFAIFALAISVLPQTLNAAEETGTITIEQQSPNGILGEWILIKPDNKRLSLKKESYIFHDAVVGNYTLLVEPPAGADTVIRIFIDQDLIDSKSQPQASFSVEQNTNMRLRVEYLFTRTGKIGVNSEPPGVGFTLKGPNDFIKEDTTPASYTEMPEGQYTVAYEEIPDCPKPSLLSDKLITEGRINFNISFNCEGIKYIEQQQTYEQSFEFVTTEIEGESVTFTDVPTREWYAPYISQVLKTGIMSGYKDSRGNPTGKYGVSDNVTIAQLSKIAHELANIDENRTRTRTTNLRAHGTWFEQYFASAEYLEWLVFKDHRIDPGRPATRGEVVATLLQALDIPRYWGKGDMFTDVYRYTDYVSSIETAATDGVVSGFTNSEGTPTGAFGPEMPVNRAEMAKIIKNAIELYKEETSS